MKINLRGPAQGNSMTGASRVPVIRRLCLGVLVLAATSWAQNRPPIAEQIAKTYGLDSFGQIERIRYTFNIPELDLFPRTLGHEPVGEVVEVAPGVRTRKHSSDTAFS